MILPLEYYSADVSQYSQHSRYRTDLKHWIWVEVVPRDPEEKKCHVILSPNCKREMREVQIN